MLVGMSPLTACLLPMMLVLATSAHEHSSFGILLDAGSTSTKLLIYRWDQHHGDSSSPPLLSLVKRQRFKPGLASIRLDYDAVEDYLGKLIKVAKKEIPNDLHADTPIYLMATAGLRFLEKKATSQLLDTVRLVLTLDKVHPFSFSPSQVQVLSGEEEGVFAWIAVNYLLGRFNESSTDETVGVLEMGGGSTQIAFLPRGPLYQEEFQVSVIDRPFHIYVQSYLHFGSSAIQRMISHKLRVPKPGQTIGNPCMLKDDQRNVTLEDGTKVSQRGMGRPAKCKDLLQKLLKPVEGITCQPKPCAIGGVYQPPVGNMTFYATQAFTYSPKSLKAMSKDNILNITRLRLKAEAYCKLTLDEAEGKGAKRAFASQDCLMGLYIPTLLTMSYGFSPDTESITVSSKIGDQRIDWALGAMLVELSKHRSKRDHEVPAYSVSSDATSGQSDGDNNNAACSQRRQEITCFSISMILCSFLILR